MQKVKVRKFVNSVFGSNTYVIHDGCEAVIVDAGDLAPVRDYVDANGLRVTAILLTHTHYDHIYGLRLYMEAWPEATVYTSEFGRQALANPKWNFSRYHDDPVSIESPRVVAIADDDEIPAPAGTTLRAFLTPGHDASCVSYAGDGRLFCGDSYIPGVKVFDTFPHSDRKAAPMWRARLREMSRTLRAYPGHGVVVAASNFNIDP